MNHLSRKANFYDRLSRFYDLIRMVPEEVRGEFRGLARIESGMTVLEIGFGTGIDLVEFAKTVTVSGKVYGLEISTGMIETARGKAEAQDVHEQIEWLQGTGTAIPLDAESCDSVFLSFSLCLFEDDDIPTVLREVHRVLRSNGTLVVVAMDSSRGGFMVKLYRWGHKFFPRFVERCGRPIAVGELLEASKFIVSKRLDSKIGHLPIAAVQCGKIPSDD